MYKQKKYLPKMENKIGMFDFIMHQRSKQNFCFPRKNSSRNATQAETCSIMLLLSLLKQIHVLNEVHLKINGLMAV